MKLLKKQLSATIALALMLTITFITAVPVAKALELRAYIYEQPNPVGLGQPIYITGWLTPPPYWPQAEIAKSLVEPLYFNLTFSITKPDGTTDNILFSVSQSTAAITLDYVCDKVGTWNVKFHWSGKQTFPRPGDAPMDSPTTSWTVQQEPVTQLWSPPQTIPLPTGFWTYPISAMNREWYQISGGRTTPFAGRG